MRTCIVPVLLLSSACVASAPATSTERVSARSSAECCEPSCCDGDPGCCAPAASVAPVACCDPAPQQRGS